MTLRAETRVRARAVQVLYALELTGAGLAEVDHGIGKLVGRPRLLLDQVEPLVAAIRADQRAIDALAEGAADHWRLERIAIVERNILRLAIFELRRGVTPAKVVIDEALWLTHRFAGARAPAFVNGILDRVAHDLGRL